VPAGRSDQAHDADLAASRVGGHADGVGDLEDGRDDERRGECDLPPPGTQPAELVDDRIKQVAEAGPALTVGVGFLWQTDITQAAKDFLAYAASEEAAESLAAIGITPALLNDKVVETYFSVDGAPQDDLSKFAFATHETLPENPTSSKTAVIQGILGDMHTAIMSGSVSPADGIAQAEDRFKNEVGE
jgi:ABC-type glycerol-3-phosphate transport system substrate-binding protein